MGGFIWVKVQRSNISVSVEVFSDGPFSGKFASGSGGFYDWVIIRRDAAGEFLGNISVENVLSFYNGTVKFNGRDSNPSSSSNSSESSALETSSSSSSLEFLQCGFDTMPLVFQTHHTLIPFTLIGEEGTQGDSDNSVIGFQIEASNSPNFDYEAIINRDNDYLTANVGSHVSDIYVPQDDRAYYQHESRFYVDIIAKDESGIKDVRTHVEPNQYEFEDVDNSFIIPKFTWDNTIFTNVSSTTTTTTVGIDNSFWVGSDNGNLNQVLYNTDFASSNNSSFILSAHVDNIAFGDRDDKMYVSTDTELSIYSVNNYLDRNEAALLFSTPNPKQSSIVLDDNGLWATQTYQGKVLELDKEDLTTIREFDGLDGPFKIIRSSFHKSHFIVGEHVLWKMRDSRVESVYEVNDYSIVDIAVSEGGMVCLLLNGQNDDYIRILDSNLYTFLINEKIEDESVRFCNYINNGSFYILAEILTTSNIYSSSHYIYNPNTKSLEKSDFNQTLATTTTTTTQMQTLAPIDVEFPNGGEFFEIGSEVEIKWASSKAVNDVVKIELYKGAYPHSLINEEAPNTGIYKWVISDLIGVDDDYRVKITWLSANDNNVNSDFSNDEFSILTTVPTTTTTTTTSLLEQAIATIFDVDNNQIVIVLRSGLLAVFSLFSKTTYGLIDSGIIDLTTASMGNESIGGFNRQTKVRVFVGTELRLSNKWDSGIIDTSLTSIYYGGGKNLVPGRKYYVNIQVYSEEAGWSELQTKEFILPK